jgi:hypothetical protein
MKFYAIDNALQEAIAAADKPVRVGIQIDASGNGDFESVPEQDILEADFFGLREAAGGTSARGEVVIKNEEGRMRNGAGPGAQVRVSFSLGEGLPWFERFVFYLDDKGVQDVRGPGRKRFVRLGLRDMSAKLRKSEEARDWMNPAVFAYSVICDKTQPGRSLVHLMAHRAGLGVGDIDCSTIPVTLPYAKLTKNIWAELSELAAAYRCHLECAPEKPLVFAYSPYQSEPLEDDEYSYTFTGEDIFYLREIDRAELYRNTVRLKINMPVELERQEIWRYEDPPALYDEGLVSAYPFRSTARRAIENEGYEAVYRVADGRGGTRPVVYADRIDSREEAAARLDCSGGGFAYAAYDTTARHDRAIITLRSETDGDLYNASIHGRPVVLDLNRSCFVRDEGEVAARGTAALNVTGSYFSEYEVDGANGTLPQYEDWADRELAERTQRRREFTVKTHRALFQARVGAKVKLKMRNEEWGGKISAFHLRYRKDGAFVASFKIDEKVG